MLWMFWWWELASGFLFPQRERASRLSGVILFSRLKTGDVLFFSLYSFRLDYFILHFRDYKQRGYARLIADAKLEHNEAVFIYSNSYSRFSSVYPFVTFMPCLSLVPISIHAKSSAKLFISEKRLLNVLFLHTTKGGGGMQLPSTCMWTSTSWSLSYKSCPKYILRKQFITIN